MQAAHPEWVLHPLSGPRDPGPNPGKRPLLKEWTKLTKTPPDMEEYVKAGCNIGLVCGKVSGTTPIDLDHELFRDGVFGDIDPNTLRSKRTDGRGHLYSELLDLPSQKHHLLGIEILNDGSNAVLPPSVHASGDLYRWNDINAPKMRIGKWRERLEKLFASERELLTMISQCRPCFRRYWADEHKAKHGMNARLFLGAFTSELFNKGANLDTIKLFAKIIYRGEYKEDKTVEEYNGWTERGLRPWTCRKLVEQCVGLTNCENCPIKKGGAKKGDEPPPIFTTVIDHPDGRHVEEILKDGAPTFLVYNPKTGEITYQDKMEIAGITFLPYPIDHRLKEAITLPDGVEEYGSVSSLRKEMLDLTLEVFDPVSSHDIIKVINDIYLTSWYATGWMEKYVERFIPVISFRGPSETGKKRGLTTARWMSYRAIYALKTTKVPSLFRVIDPWKGTLVLDEADLRESSESADFVEFINSRADGVPIPRYNTEKKGTEWFYSFGLTVTATRRPYYDDGIESRIIVFPAESTDKPEKYPLIPPKEWLVKARSLQRKLLLFRLRHLQGDIPSNLIIPGVKGFRVREAFLALQALEKEDPGLMENIAETAKKLERRVIADRANSPEGLVLNHVYGTLGDDDVRIERDKVYWIILTKYMKEGGEVTYTPLTLKRVADGLGRVFSPSEIARVWRGLGQDVSTQVRVEGKRYKGVLYVKTPARLNKEFQKYVPDALDVTEGFKTVQQELVSPEGTSPVSPLPYAPVVPPVPDVPVVQLVPSITPTAEAANSTKNVPDVPGVPDSYVSIPTSKKLEEIEIGGDTHREGGDKEAAGTLGTAGTPPLQPPVQIASVPVPDVPAVPPAPGVTPGPHDPILGEPQEEIQGQDPRSLTEEILGNLSEEVERTLEESRIPKGPDPNLKPEHRISQQAMAQQMMMVAGNARPTNAKAVEAVLNNLVNTGYAIDPTYDKPTLRKIAEGVLRAKGWI